MSILSDFIKTQDTNMGVFYPKNYLVAAFPSLKDANKAAAVLLGHVRISPADVLAASGDEVLQTLAEHSERQGAWGKLMRSVSRALATGEIYTDQDMERAARGAGFLFAYCPSESLKDKVWKALQPMSPIVARHYGFPGIEHFTGETEHRPQEAETQGRG